MTSRERVFTAVRGEAVDRPPISFWGHFYDRESSAADLADATLDFQRQYQWDWVKLNPRKHYHVEPWAVRYRYDGAAKPVLESWPIHRPEDWSVTERAPDRAAFDEQIDAVRRVRRGLPAGVPLIETVFTPLAVLGEMVETPAVLKDHLRQHPGRVRAALESVTRVYERFVGEILAAGADGLFFATVDWGSRDWMSAEEYRDIARPFDLRVLSVAKDAPFNVLHVCKSRNLLFEFADYPVAAFSWAATDPTNPSFADALPRLSGGLMGGISQDGALQKPTPESALAELRHGLDQTGGRRWLVAPGCSIPPTTPVANLEAIRAAVEELRPAPHRSV
jgi:uroporphyrinogen decarboxylase